MGPRTVSTVGMASVSSGNGGREIYEVTRMAIVVAPLNPSIPQMSGTERLATAARATTQGRPYRTARSYLSPRTAGCAAWRALVLVQLVREVDDAQAGAALKEGAQAQDVAVVEDALPPVPRDKRRQDDGDALMVLLFEPFEVRQHRGDERAVG